MIRTIAYATLGVLTIYVLGAFVAWDFNAANWVVEGRVIAAFLGFLAGVSGGMMSVFRYTCPASLPYTAEQFHQGMWCEALTTDPKTRVVTVDQLNTLMDRAAYAERFHNSDIAGSIADEIRAIIVDVKP